MPMSDVADAIAILGRWDRRGWDSPVDADERRGGCGVIEAEVAILGRWDQRGWDLPVDADERRGRCGVIEAEQRKLRDEIARVVVHVHLR